MGLPLEMVHGSWRIAAIYVTGVIGGRSFDRWCLTYVSSNVCISMHAASLGASVFDSQSMLIGASGAVYALLAAHVANVVLNYKEMACAAFRVLGILLIGT